MRKQNLLTKPKSGKTPFDRNRVIEHVEMGIARFAGIAARLSEDNEAEDRAVKVATENDGSGFYRPADTFVFPQLNLGSHALANIATEVRRDKVLANALDSGTQMANEERFTASYYSEPLTEYAVGWTDKEDLESLINFIAPRVIVGRRFEYKLAVNVESFLSEINDERAIGGEFKRIEYKGTTQYSKTVNRGLMYRIDLDEEGAGFLNESIIVGRIIQRLRRNKLRRTFAALAVATAGNLSTPVTWTYSGGNPNAQPNENLRVLAQGIQKGSGVFPNRLLIDLLSWNIRKNTYAQQPLAAGAIAAYGQTPQDLAADLALEGVMINKALFQFTEWVAPTKNYIQPQTPVMFYGQDNPTRDDPTNLKNFVTPVADGDFRVYRQPKGAKFVDITVEHYDQPLVTANIGCGQLVVT